jgi:hypothetical protein
MAAEDAADSSTIFVVTAADGGGFFFSEDRGLPRLFLAGGVVDPTPTATPAVPLVLARRSGVSSDSFIAGDVTFFAVVSLLVVAACDTAACPLLSAELAVGLVPFVMGPRPVVVVVVGLLAK